jgi:hypothetical protein
MPIGLSLEVLECERSEAVFSLIFIESLWPRAGLRINLLVIIGLINSKRRNR